MTHWFTADPHLGHHNILKLCRRDAFLTPDEIAALDRKEPLKVSQGSLERHDTALIDNINAVVAPTDELRILGDFCWKGSETAIKYLARINCKNVYLVQGNHDHDSVLPLFKGVWQQGMFKTDAVQMWLNHYPMRSWDHSFHGSYHLHGHTHCQLPPETAHSLVLDVGVDGHDFKPWSLDEIVAYMEPRKALGEQTKNKRSW